MFFLDKPQSPVNHPPHGNGSHHGFNIFAPGGNWQGATLYGGRAVVAARFGPSYWRSHAQSQDIVSPSASRQDHRLYHRRRRQLPLRAPRLILEVRRRKRRWTHSKASPSGLGMFAGALAPVCRALWPVDVQRRMPDHRETLVRPSSTRTPRCSAFSLKQPAAIVH